MMMNETETETVINLPTVVRVRVSRAQVEAAKLIRERNDAAQKSTAASVTAIANAASSAVVQSGQHADTVVAHQKDDKPFDIDSFAENVETRVSKKILEAKERAYYAAIKAAEAAESAPDPYSEH
jgi:hypothetical protein